QVREARRMAVASPCREAIGGGGSRRLRRETEGDRAAAPRQGESVRRPLMPAKQRVQAQPLIAVRDVRKSTLWYGTMFGLSHTVSVHDDLYQRMMDGKRMVLQLHAW